MFHSHGNTLTVRKFERLTVQTFEMRKIKRCEHHNHVNFCLARAWSHGCVVTRLGDTILDFNWGSVLRMGRWKNNWKKKKTNSQTGSLVPCQESENINVYVSFFCILLLISLTFPMWTVRDQGRKAVAMRGKIKQGQIFQPAENSSVAFFTYLTSHPTRSRLIAEKKKHINKRYLWGLQLRWRWLPPAEQ